MRSLESIIADNFNAAILEGLRQLMPENITAKTNVANWAIEILEIEKEIERLEEPVNIVGTPQEAMRQLQDRIKRRDQLENGKRRLVERISSEGWRIFSEGLIGHLTGKTESARRTKNP